MKVNLAIISCYCIYVSMCAVLSMYEKNTEQRRIGFLRSTVNFVLLYPFSYWFTDVPEGSGSFWVLPLWVVLSDAIFTATHRLLHTKPLYWIHKQHHSSNNATGTYSTSTFDSHPLEFFFGNITTALIPTLLVRGTETVQWIWFLSATINTILGHFQEGPHLVHHRRVKYNYGQGFYLWDKLFGTYIKE